MVQTARFSFERLKIPDVVLVTAIARGDDRGFFCELYRQDEFEREGLPSVWLQDNFSYSKKNVLRGMHYQLPPHGQAKLVSAMVGEIYDVAIDIRPSSPTFLEWVGVRLSAAEPRLLYVPAGFAHGFCVLSDEARVTYKVSALYDQDSERGVVWNDPRVGIDWPVSNPVVSPKDAALSPAERADLFPA